jgi:hypothetical protein
MKKFFRELISDENKLNEKAFIGFIAFALIGLITIADIVTGIMQRELPIHRWIFEGLLLFAAASLAIGSVDKYVNSKKDGNSEGQQVE